MNSWEKSDTCFSDVPCVDCYDGQRDLCNKTSFFRKDEKLGSNDHSLMQRLSNAGTEHRKYMRMMPSGTDCVNLGRKLYDVSMNGLKSCPYKEYIPTFLKGTGSGLATIVVGYRKLGLYYEANTPQRVIENVFTN